MKHSVWFLYILLLGVSCAGHKPRISPVIPPEAEQASTSPEVMEQLSSIERVIQRVKQNPPSLKKYFVLDADAAIIVKADLTEIRQDTGEMETFEVVYDLQFLQTENSRIMVPFWVKALETGVVRHDKLQWHLREDSAGLLLAFDDDYQDVWERNLDFFDRYGAKVTFFIQGEVCPFCTLALTRGHDVGYHSLHHLNLPKISKDEFFQETLLPVDTFRDKGVPLTSFAYPFGLSEPWMHEELLKSFKILRGYGVTFRVYDSETIRNGYISSRAIDNILFKKDEDFEAMIAQMLRAVKFIGGDRILPLTTHTISDTADWGIKPHRLEYLLQTAKDLGLKFYRYKDFIE